MEAANAKLQVTKITARLDEAKKHLEEMKTISEEKEREQKELAVLKQKFFKVVEDVETKVRLLLALPTTVDPCHYLDIVEKVSFTCGKKSDV